MRDVWTLLAVVCYVLANAATVNGQSCGGNFTSENGFILSPNYPQPYPNKTECLWNVGVPEGKRIRVTFNRVDIDNPIFGTCYFAYIRIQDGNSTESPYLTEACGNSTPKALRTFTNSMRVQFQGSTNSFRTGFNISYSTEVDDTFLLVTRSGDGTGHMFLLDPNTTTNYNIHPNSMLYTPVAVDYDVVKQEVYWTENDQTIRGVKVSRLNGSNSRFVKFFEGNATLEGLAVDHLSRVVIYSDAYNKKIVMMSMTTWAERTVISTALDKPRAIVLHIHNGQIFWTDWGDRARIEKANYDGSGRVELVNSLLSRINALALDMASDLLYWADGGTDRLEAVDLNGNNRRTIVQMSTDRHIFGLALLGNTFYMTDQIENSTGIRSHILKCPLTGPDALNITTLITTSYTLNDIHAYQPHTTGSNGCGSNNGECGVFCLPLPNNQSRCACPDGQVLDSGNNKTCEYDGPVPPTPSAGNSGCNSTLTAPNGTIWSPGYPNDYPSMTYCKYQIIVPTSYRITLNFSAFNVEGDDYVCYDTVDLYDGDGSKLSGILCGPNMVGPYRSFTNNLTVIFKTDPYVQAYGFKASYTSDQDEGFFLITSIDYSFGYHKGYIYRLDTRTLSRHLLMSSSMYAPSAIDYDPDGKRVYWTDSSTAAIKSVNLDGTNITTIKPFDFFSELVGLAVDPVSKLIFYADARYGIIGVLQMSTWKHKTIIDSGMVKPRAIVLDTKNGVMYWSDWGLGGNSRIEKANYDGSGRTVIATNYNNASRPHGLALDLSGNTLYWVDEGTGMVQACALDGTNLRTVKQRSGQQRFTGLALFDNALYITNNNGDGLDWSILKLPLGPPVGDFITVLNHDADMEDIHAYTTHPDVTGPNGCTYNNGGCDSSAFCLPLPGNNRKCTCQDQYSLNSQNVCVYNATLTTSTPAFTTVSPEAVCGPSLNYSAPTGMLQSPGYPNKYPSGIECIYRITAPEDYVITLNFTDFEIEESQSLGCVYDFLEIRDGADSSAPLLAKLCGQTPPRPIKSFSNTLWIRFYTDSSFVLRGYSATYSTTQDRTFFLVTKSKRGSGISGSIFLLDMETLTNYNINFNISLYKPVSVDYDPVTARIYWTEASIINVIRSAYLNGTGLVTHFDLGAAAQPEGLAVDSMSRLYFYTDAGNDVIGMVSMRNGLRKIVINSDLDRPRAIEVDPLNGTIFWTDWGAVKKIERANYDGTERRILVNSLLDYINALVIDHNYQRLYWADGGTDKVESVMMADGSDRRVVFSSRVATHYFYGITLFNDDLYLTDQGGNASTGELESWIIRMPLNRSNGTLRGNATVYASHPDLLNDLHGYYEHVANTGANGCGTNNGGCSHFCLPRPGNHSVCACPEYFALGSSNTQCYLVGIPGSTTPAPAPAQCGATMTAPSGVIESPNFPANYPNGVDCIIKITVDPNKRILLEFTHFDLEYSGTCDYDYVEIRDGLDERASFLKRYCGSGTKTSVKTFTNTMWIKFHTDATTVKTGFRARYSADPDSSFFLVSKSSHGAIFNGDIFLLDVETVSNYVVQFDQRLYQPMDVDFDPVDYRIYWTESGALDAIRSSRYNGQNVTEVLISATSVYEAVAVDQLSRLLFLTDSALQRIGVLSMRTWALKTIFDLRNETSAPKAIVVDPYNGLMVWSSVGSVPKIEKASYDGSGRQTLVSTYVHLVNALAIDTTSGMVYWADASMDRIETINYMDGTGRRTLAELSPQHHFFGLALYRNTLYITGQTITTQAQPESDIMKLPLSGQQNITVFAGHPDILYDIHGVDFSLFSVPNGCSGNNGGCSSLCFPRSGNGHTCACPDGQNLLSDSVSCVEGPANVAVSVTTSPAMPILSDGSTLVTLTCVSQPVVTSAVTWRGVANCVPTSINSCDFRPYPTEYDERPVSCSVVVNGRSFSGDTRLSFQYPPPQPPVIRGQPNVMEGDSFSLTCIVSGGKPLVTSVDFSCPDFPDNADNVTETSVSSTISIPAAKASHNAMMCRCRAVWAPSQFMYEQTSTVELTVGSSSGTSSAHGGSSSAAIGGGIGGALLAILLVVVILLVVFFIIRRRRSHANHFSSNNEPRPEGVPNPMYGEPFAMHDVLGAEAEANFEHQPDRVKNNSYYELEESGGTSEVSSKTKA